MRVGFHRRILAPLMVTCLLAGCAQQTTNGITTVPPSAAKIEAARLAELRYRAKAHIDLAAAYYERSQFAIALDEISEAVQIDPRVPAAYNLRGLTYMALREDGEAEAAFREGMRIAPTDSELGNNYGYFLCSRGRIDEGLQRLNVVIHDPLYQTPEKPLVNAANCAMRRKDTAAAEDYLRRALRLQPVNLSGATLLAELQEQGGHLGEARETLRPLLRTTPPPREVLQTLIRLDAALDDSVQLGEHRALLQRYYADPGNAPVRAPEQAR